MPKLLLHELRNVPHVARARYDFATDGGGIGDKPLRGDRIPKGAIIVDVLMKVDTVPTSGGGATLALKAESAGDLRTAAAISGAPWATTGGKRGSLIETATPVVVTATRRITATIATATLTAGKFTVWVRYVLP